VARGGGLEDAVCNVGAAGRVLRAYSLAGVTPKLPVYELQPRDVGCERIKLSKRRGVLISEEYGVDGAGDLFESFLTNGDGGCALHAAWGHPSHGQMLELPQGQLQGRRLLCELLPDTFHAALQHFGNWQVFEGFYFAIWSELAVPGAEGSGSEAGMFWENLQLTNPQLAAEVLRFLEVKKLTEESSHCARMRY